MAQINLGNFGSLIAQPVAQPRLPAAAPNALAEGIGQVGEIVGRLAMNELQREQQMQDQRNREQLTLEREQRRAQAARLHAETVNTLAGLSDALAAESAEGRLDKNDLLPQWAERSQKVIDEAVGRMPTELQDAGLTLLLAAQGRGADQMRTIKATRDRQDTAAGVRSYLAESERYAARGGAQADEAIRNVSQFLSSPVAAAAGLDGQETARRFAESVRFRQAADLVQANPAAALATLRDKDRFPELDPDKRASLIAHADAAVLRAQERARIEAERIAREQERVYAGAASVFESGRAFSAEYADQVLSRLRGSPYESAIREMISVGPQNVAAATLPIAQQRQQLDALMARANTQGSSPPLNKEIERRQKVLGAAERDVRDDPLGAALERGIVQQVAPLNVTDLGTLPAAIAQRTQVAQAAATWAGQPVSPLRPQEAEQLAQAMRAMPVPQRAATIDLLARAVPDGQALRAMAGQVAGKDQALATAIVLAADGNKTTAGRTVTELYLRGADAIATRELKGDRDREARAAATIRGNMVQAVGDAYFSPQACDLYVDAAIKVQAALKAEGAGDADERALRLATGGVVTRNGRQVVKPYGWTDREFDDWVSGARERIRTGGGEFVAGGARLSAEQLAAALPNSRMAAVGSGQYVLVGPGGQIVRRVDGTPLVLDTAR